MLNGRVALAKSQGGFTYIGLLLFIAISGIGLAVIGQVWHVESQRQREKDLLFIGEQYAHAISSYYESSPGGIKQYPASIEDLLLDTRFPVVRRHLRKQFIDPMTNSEDWGFIRQQERIVGIYSLSNAKPIKQEGFITEHERFAGAVNYQGWKFVPAALAEVGLTTSSVAVNSSAVENPVNPAALNGGTSAAANPPNVTPPVAATPPSESSNQNPSQGYAACQALLQSENASCRASCGLWAGQVCRDCYAAAFNNYRACL
jgi:type II secretory pathway pseudopilin PulG